MQIYLVQGHVKQAEKPYTARIWCSSQAQAASARSRLRSDLNVAREDIRTTAVDLDTRATFRSLRRRERALAAWAWELHQMRAV